MESVSEMISPPEKGDAGVVDLKWTEKYSEHEIKVLKKFSKPLEEQGKAKEYGGGLGIPEALQPLELPLLELQYLFQS